MSTHLGKLRAAGVVKSRKVGVSTLYSIDDAAMPAVPRKIWSLVRSEVHDGALDKDRQRLATVLKSRDKEAAWPDAVAGEMERHYSPGRTWESLARATIGLLKLGDVLDAGSGDGSIAELLAPHAASVTCVDQSPRMITAAIRRIGETGNVRYHHGAVEDLPFAADSFDVALLLNVLTELPDPQVALNRLAHVLRPGGNLVIVTLDAHEHAEQATAYRHVHPGFAPATLRKMIGRTGLAVDSCAITSRERRQPRFRVVTAFAHKEARR